MLAGALLLALSSAPSAPDPALDADLRCIIAITLAVARASEESAPKLMTGVMYFYGRVDGRAPHIDYKTELRRVAGPSPKLTDFKADLLRCSDILGTRAALLDSLTHIFDGL